MDKSFSFTYYVNTVERHLPEKFFDNTVAVFYGNALITSIVNNKVHINIIWTWNRLLNEFELLFDNKLPALTLSLSVLDHGVKTDISGLDLRLEALHSCKVAMFYVILDVYLTEE